METGLVLGGINAFPVVNFRAKLAEMGPIFSAKQDIVDDVKISQHPQLDPGRIFYKRSRSRSVRDLTRARREPSGANRAGLGR